MKKILALVLALALVLTLFAACGGDKPAESQEPGTIAKKVDTDFSEMSWDEICAEAKGQTINWYLWGGSTKANSFIDTTVAEKAAEYGVTINRVGVNNITEAVNIVISEKQAGKTEKGTVDLFWINGSNFMMMQQAGVTFPNWSENLPNAKYVNWEDPSIKFDMGLEVKGQESPWGACQLQLVYDSAKIAKEDLPKNYTELLTYAKAHPGRITYPAPPAFYGTRFVKAGIYELTGGYEQYNKKGITKEQFADMADPMFDYLEELNQYLWHSGNTYTKGETDGFELLNNGEVDFAFTLSGVGVGGVIAEGRLPETAKVYCLDTAIADTNYVALTFNGKSKAGALVVANILIDPEVQAINVGNGAMPVLDPSKMTEAQNKLISDAKDKLGEGTYCSAEELSRTRAPEVSGYLNQYIEEIWTERIGG